MLGVGPRELRSLAVQIESIVATSREGWNPADEAKFKRLGTSLPRPEALREWAEQWTRQGRPPNGKKVIVQQYTGWIRTVFDMKQIAARNKPGSPQKMLRDLLKKGRQNFGV